MWIVWILKVGASFTYFLTLVLLGLNNPQTLSQSGGNPNISAEFKSAEAHQSSSAVCVYCFLFVKTVEDPLNRNWKQFSWLKLQQLMWVLPFVLQDNTSQFICFWELLSLLESIFFIVLITSRYFTKSVSSKNLDTYTNHWNRKCKRITKRVNLFFMTKMLGPYLSTFSVRYFAISGKDK